MIYDSPEQKQFILEAVKKFPCNYEQALQLANTFGQGIQDGQVIPPKDQPKAKTADQQPTAPTAPTAPPAQREDPKATADLNAKRKPKVNR